MSLSSIVKSVLAPINIVAPAQAATTPTKTTPTTTPVNTPAAVYTPSTSTPTATPVATPAGTLSDASSQPGFSPEPDPTGPLNSDPSHDSSALVTLNSSDASASPGTPQASEQNSGVAISPVPQQPVSEQSGFGEAESAPDSSPRQSSVLYEPALPAAVAKPSPEPLVVSASQPQMVLVTTPVPFSTTVSTSQAAPDMASSIPVVSSSTDQTQATQTTESQSVSTSPKTETGGIKQKANRSTTTTIPNRSQALSLKLARAYGPTSVGANVLLGTQKVSLDTYLSQYRLTGAQSSIVTLLDKTSNQGMTTTAGLGYASRKAMTAYTQAASAIPKTLDVAG